MLFPARITVGNVLSIISSQVRITFGDRVWLCANFWKRLVRFFIDGKRHTEAQAIKRRVSRSQVGTPHPSIHQE